MTRLNKLNLLLTPKALCRSGGSRSLIVRLSGGLFFTKLEHGTAVLYLDCMALKSCVSFVC